MEEVEKHPTVFARLQSLIKVGLRPVAITMRPDLYEDLVASIADGLKVQHRPSTKSWTVRFVDGKTLSWGDGVETSVFVDPNAMDFTLLVDAESCIEVCSPESVRQRDALEYFMRKLGVVDYFAFSTLISYPSNKMRKMLNHEYYVDTEFAEKLSAFTYKSTYWWKSLAKPVLSKEEKNKYKFPQ